MTAGVSASISFDVQASQIGAADLGTPRAPAVLDFLAQFVPGTDTDAKADLMWSDEVSIASNTAANLDMAGVLATGLGATITYAEVVAIALIADPTNTTNLTFFGAASNPFNGPLTGTTPALVLKPGDAALLVSKDGWPVTAATGDILAASNASGAAAKYKAIIIGRTVAS